MSNVEQYEGMSVIEYWELRLSRTTDPDIRKQLEELVRQLKLIEEANAR